MGKSGRTSPALSHGWADERGQASWGGHEWSGATCRRGHFWESPLLSEDFWQTCILIYFLLLINDNYSFLLLKIKSSPKPQVNLILRGMKGGSSLPPSSFFTENSVTLRYCKVTIPESKRDRLWTPGECDHASSDKQIKSLRYRNKQRWLSVSCVFPSERKASENSYCDVPSLWLEWTFFFWMGTSATAESAFRAVDWMPLTDSAVQNDNVWHSRH